MATPTPTLAEKLDKIKSPGFRANKGYAPRQSSDNSSAIPVTDLVL